MAGAVGMEVISPMPMAPQATSSPGFSTTMALDLRDLVRPQQAQGAELGGGPAVHHRVLLRQGEAHGHDHAALDLAFTGDGIHRLATSWAATMRWIFPSSPSTQIWVA